MKLLENSDVNLIISSLYGLLTRSQTNQAEDKMIGMVLKCILKVAEAIKGIKSSLQPKKILQILSKYVLQHHETEGIDLPIKTVKIILRQLVGLYGEQLRELYKASNVQNEKMKG